MNPEALRKLAEGLYNLIAATAWTLGELDRSMQIRLPLHLLIAPVATANSYVQSLSPHVMTICRFARSILATALLTCLNLCLYGQRFRHLDDRLEQIVEHGDVVLEATSTGINFTYDLKWGLVTSTVYQVNQVFRGDFADRYVEFISSGGTLGGLSESVSHGLNASADRGEAGIFSFSQDRIFLEQGRLGYKVIGSSANFLSTRTPMYYSSDSDPVVERHIYQRIEKLTGESRRFVATSDHLLEQNPYAKWAESNYVPTTDTAVAILGNFVGTNDTLSSDAYFKIQLSPLNACIMLEGLSFTLNYDTTTFYLPGRITTEHPFNSSYTDILKTRHSTSKHLPKYQYTIQPIGPGQISVQFKHNRQRGRRAELCPSSTYPILTVPLAIRVSNKKRTKGPVIENFVITHFDHAGQSEAVAAPIVLEQYRFGDVRLIPACLSTPILWQQVDIDHTTERTVFTLHGKNFCEETVPTIPTWGTNSRRTRNLPLPTKYILSRTDSTIQFTIPESLYGSVQGRPHEGPPDSGYVYVQNKIGDGLIKSRAYIKMEF